MVPPTLKYIPHRALQKQMKKKPIFKKRVGHHFPVNKNEPVRAWTYGQKKKPRETRNRIFRSTNLTANNMLSARLPGM